MPRVGGMLAINPETAPRTLCDVLTGACELPNAIVEAVAPNVDLVVGTERTMKTLE